MVGGGPAGLMAAEVLASAGLSVTVLDHMPSVGRKLLLAGRSGLNLTNNEPIEQLLGRYGASASRLGPALRAFGPDDLRAWSESLGEHTFVGSSGRVFPASLRSTPLLRLWLGRLAGLGVELRTRCRWLGCDADPLAIRVVDADGSESTEAVDAVVLALGGASWPRVGSTGGWVPIVSGWGVAVAELRPSNCGVEVLWSDTFRARFAGTPIKNVRWTVGDRSGRGEAVVTDRGIEGGAVYSLGPELRGELDDRGSATVWLDLLPDLDRARVLERLTRRRPKESVSTSLRRIGVADVGVGLLREATGNELPTRVDELVDLLGAVPVVVRGTQPLDRAISTAGGIDLGEIDRHYGLVRRPGVFVCGEMLDWDAPTGGYLLQACFSTGVAAARGVIEWLGPTGPCDLRPDQSGGSTT